MVADDRLAGLDGARVVVEVPATTANLGAGYDCLGMALDLVNRVEIEVRRRPGVELSVSGEGEGELSAEGDNRLLAGLRAAVAEITGDPAAADAAGWRITMTNRIPLARGLGSSAAATVAGVVAGNELLGRPLAEADLLRLATAIEGHPDNAAPALLGGFVVTAALGDTVEAIRFDVPRGLRAVVLIPELRLATAEMRRVLPASVPRADAVANLGRVAVGVAAMATGRRDALRFLVGDRLHEPYRAAAYPQLPRLIADALAAGAVSASLSGSGSAVIAFTDTIAGVARIEAAFRAAAADTDLPARVELVSPRNTGAGVIAEAT